MQLVSSLLLAVLFLAPPMPDETYDDTEVVTNFPFAATCRDARVFSFSLELDATPSNNVEIAFGRDSDGDGRLSRGESAALPVFA